MQGSWIFTSSFAGQETKGTVEFIVVPLYGRQYGKMKCGSVLIAELQFEVRIFVFTWRFALGIELVFPVLLARGQRGLRF